jgi:hypothetical protein
MSNDASGFSVQSRTRKIMDGRAGLKIDGKTLGNQLTTLKQYLMMSCDLVECAENGEAKESLISWMPNLSFRNEAEWPDILMQVSLCENVRGCW